MIKFRIYILTIEKVICQRDTYSDQNEIEVQNRFVEKNQWAIEEAKDYEGTSYSAEGITFSSRRS